jgi:hypothetical protein
MMSAQPVADVRSLDGTGNNLTNPSWGSDSVDLLRLSAAAYADGISSPAGVNRPSARAISNAVADHGTSDIKNDRALSNFVYAWGQFIDHDLDLTTSGSPTTLFNISVPTGDAQFDPNSTGTQIIPLARSNSDPATGTSTSNPRQQINSITAFLDGSMVYGSDATRAAALRTFSGGLLKTSAGNLLPLNTAGLANANDTHQTPNDQLFLAGDVRANENTELTSVQTLFVREHNRIATQLAKDNPTWTDEQLYQEARRVVIGEIEAITFNEFLPALLGQGAIRPYQGYNANVNPGISTEFSTAAFRFGHSMLGNDVDFLDNNGNPTRNPMALSQIFFNPNVVKQTGIDPILKYLASDRAEEIDTKVVDSLRNMLFGQPGQGGLDLAALNIQRGRDHGLSDYNTTRAAMGLPKVTSFAQITSDTVLQQKLKDLYGTVDNIDLWVGGLAENHLPGSSMGATFTRIIADQFMRLRDGDRFWYENTMTGRQLDQVRHTTLADIIRRNTGDTNVQDNVFIFHSDIVGQVFADLNHNGKRDPGERGLPGRVVELLAGDGTLVKTATTALDGTYHFDNVDLGAFSVREQGASASTSVSITRGLVAMIDLGDLVDTLPNHGPFDGPMNHGHQRNRHSFAGLTDGLPADDSDAETGRHGHLENS